MLHRLQSFTLALLMLGATAMMALLAGHAGADMQVVDAEHQFVHSRAARLRTSLDPTDPDTVWIGHVNTSTGLPGEAGGTGPFHIGRGPNRPTSDISAPASTWNGVWDFDHFHATETTPDSLQGWWPIICPYASVGNSTFPDRQRPFFGFDYGNQGNYVINQGAAIKRTFGVTGYWHRDPGKLATPALFDSVVTVIPGPNVEWLPLAGTASAWCGLRAHGDLTARDSIPLGGTGNFINEDVLQYNGDNKGTQIGSTSATGTDKNFPGYGSQWDQMMYRDIALNDNANLNISFKYRTNMSTGLITDTALRVGWFDKDPLRDTFFIPADNNFISSSDAIATNSAPIDSFMVYIGVPVEPQAGPNNDFVASDSLHREIYDVKRRWFSEVIAIDRTYREILTKSGVNATATFTLNIAGGTGSLVQQILDDQPGAGGKVRIVFRIKTNRSFDDEDNFVSGVSSQTAGAAIVDDVVLNSWGAANGDFEAVNAINNDALVLATNAWKSTGKPPGVFFHAHSIEPGGGLSYSDPCGGAVTSAGRFCNMRGKIITPGDHDRAEKPGGDFQTNFQDRQDYFVSPTINLMSTADGAYNAMGIDKEIADVTDDYNLFHDIYVNGLNFAVTGDAMRYAWQSYPAQAPNGNKVWGEVRKQATFYSFGTAQGCFQTLALSGGPRVSGNLLTSNASGIPDSMRVYLEHLGRCYFTGAGPPATSANCHPNSGAASGFYTDNFSFACIDAMTGPPGLVAISWDFFNDSFPTNGDDAFPGTPAFDTLAANLRTGHNTAPGTGDPSRSNIPGDTALVIAPGSNTRMDLVFRILPGVGNYLQIGNRASGVRKVPAGGSASGNKVATNDATFWGKYMEDNGAFGTGGDGTSGPGHPGKATDTWDPNTWNSARMDTAEINLFPCNGAVANAGKLTLAHWATMYSELEPKYATLGITKNRCFLINNNLARNDAANITCSLQPPWTGTPGSGYDPNEVPGQPGKTYEYTKIIPDGQLTPGAHVEYFFRKSVLGDPITAFGMVADTTRVVPQTNEGNFDGHRWLEFSILPDRWKDPAWQTQGQGMACMLVVDLADRYGDELVWVSLADSIGLTAAARRGAHNGWRARGDQNIFDVPVSGDPSIAVYPHLGQAGTLWDIYKVKGGGTNVSAGHLGSRYANAPTGLAGGKGATFGPTKRMLRQYRTLIYLTGDLSGGTFGPTADMSDDDHGLFADYALTPTQAGEAPQPRLTFINGSHFIADAGAKWPDYTSGILGARLASSSYRSYSGNNNQVADLIPIAPLNTIGAIYGVLNACFVTHDVLTAEPSVSTAAVKEFYENVPGGSSTTGYGAAVYAPESDTGRLPRTLVEGFRQAHVGSRFTLARGGFRMHYLNVLTNVYCTLNPICCPTVVDDVGDMPGVTGRLFVNSLMLRSSNPTRGMARFEFGLARTEKVQVRVFDVAGRQIKLVANRVFEAGKQHLVTWDGTDDQGHGVAPGVYFYQLRSPSFVSQKKLAVLKQ